MNSNEASDAIVGPMSNTPMPSLANGVAEWVHILEAKVVEAQSTKPAPAGKAEPNSLRIFHLEKRINPHTLLRGSIKRPYLDKGLAHWPNKKKSQIKERGNSLPNNSN